MTSGRSWGRLYAPAAFVAALSFAACHDVKVGPGEAAAVSLDSIASPSIVVGDSLRDTFGIVRPLRGTAYDNDGSPIPGFPIKYRVLDSGITLDSLTGYARGNVVLSSPIRVLADAAGLQTSSYQLFVIPSPDTVFANNPSDTLFYSVLDTNVVLSPELSLTVGHKIPKTTTDQSGYAPVQAYIVSYAITSTTDTSKARLVDGSNRPSLVDTTGSTGVAGRQIRLRPLALSTLTDSVIVLATVKYRGTPIVGSPIRFVLQIRPAQ